MLIALSGGPDSVCCVKLLLMLKSHWRLKLHALHVNHGLRTSAERDERRIVNWCRAWNIPLIVRRLDVRRLSKAKQISVEEAGRDGRYELLVQTAKRLKIKRIVLAHTQDDQAETVLMRLIRGTGLRGLKAMSAVRREGKSQLIIRPLLGLSKRSLETVLKEQHIPFCVDPTNRSKTYLRNRIRLELLPRIQHRFNPQFEKNLVDLSQEAANLYDWVEQDVKRQWQKMASRRGNVLMLSVPKLRRVHPALKAELLFKSLEALYGDRRVFTRDHMLSLISLLEKDSRRLALPRGLKAYRQRDRIYLQTR